MRLALIATLAVLITSPAQADWADTLAEANGQTVYWNAWGGDGRTNAFIEWVSAQTEREFNVSVRQVKLADTAEAVTRVLSEKAAAKNRRRIRRPYLDKRPKLLVHERAGLVARAFRRGPSKCPIP
jgi:putative thiamine transport system substrate-binding protein